MINSYLYTYLYNLCRLFLYTNYFIIIRFLPEFSFIHDHSICPVPPSLFTLPSIQSRQSYPILAWYSKVIGTRFSYRCCCHLERELCIALITGSRVITFREPEGLIKRSLETLRQASSFQSAHIERIMITRVTRALLTLWFRRSTVLFIRGNLKIETCLFPSSY